MILTYDAVDTLGKQTTDSIEATSRQEAISTLQSKGLRVTRMEESERGKGSPERPATVQHSISLKVLVLFTRQMAMLLRSGSGLVPAISAIRRQMPSVKNVALLGEVIDDLESGQTLSDALKRHPKAFDPVYCAVVAAGEASATLGNMFMRLSNIVGKKRAMRKKILGSMAYPIVLTVMCTTIVFGMLLFVLPRFAEMFKQLAVDTPASTEVLLAFGAWLRLQWMWLVAVFGLIVVTAGATLATTNGRQWICDIQIGIPIVGKIRSRLIQAQVFRTVGMLLESRVGLLDSLELVRGSTNNHRFQKLFDGVEEAVTSGSQPSSAFESSGLVEPYICEAVRTGEESGNLGEALSYCADVLDEDNEELVNVVMRMLEPLILMVMGVVVGGVAISLFLPLFDLTSAIQ